MAKSQIRLTPTVCLELSAEEATWLRALLQNPIGALQDPPSDYEDEFERRIRSAIFEALPSETTLLLST